MEGLAATVSELRTSLQQIISGLQSLVGLSLINNIKWVNFVLGDIFLKSFLMLHSFIQDTVIEFLL